MLVIALLKTSNYTLHNHHFIRTFEDILSNFELSLNVFYEIKTIACNFLLRLFFLFEPTLYFEMKHQESM